LRHFERHHRHSSPTRIVHKSVGHHRKEASGQVALGVRNFAVFQVVKNVSFAKFSYPYAESMNPTPVLQEDRSHFKIFHKENAVLE
jgi:hypothetical protein